MSDGVASTPVVPDARGLDLGMVPVFFAKDVLVRNTVSPGISSETNSVLSSAGSAFICALDIASMNATEGRLFEESHGERFHGESSVDHGAAGAAGLGRNESEEGSGDDSLDEHVVLLS
jgi:hypothetical protein